MMHIAAKVERQIEIQTEQWHLRIVDGIPMVWEHGRPLPPSEIEDRAQEWACAIFMAIGEARGWR